MKYKTTDREQRQNQYCVVGIGYCDIQNITRFLNAQAYTAGVYGWRADFYEFGNVSISTGYAPLTFGYDKEAKKMAEIIKKNLLDLEKKLNAGKIKTTADWHKENKKMIARIEKIIDKARSEVIQK